MKVSEKKLDLVEKLIEEFELNLYDYKELMFDLLREHLQKQTIYRLYELLGIEQADL